MFILPAGMIMKCNLSKFEEMIEKALMLPYHVRGKYVHSHHPLMFPFRCPRTDNLTLPGPTNINLGPFNKINIGPVIGLALFYPNLKGRIVISLLLR